MAVVVIGGQSRKVGKTSVVAGLIRAMPERRWTAIKITQCSHGIGSTNGKACDCELDGCNAAIREERDATTGTDSSRYLAAGAVRALWIRFGEGALAEAMPWVREEIAGVENVILESNSVLEFLWPDFCIFVFDLEVVDIKASALRYLDRADAFLLPVDGAGRDAWGGLLERVSREIPKFFVRPPKYVTADLVFAVSERITGVGK